MKIPVAGGKEQFDVRQFLTDNGLTLKGTAGKYAETPVMDKENAVFRVVDKDGNESEFDAFKFMHDNGAEPDKEGFFKAQQTEQRKMADAQQAGVDTKLKGELESAGMGEYLMRTAAPYTSALFKSGKEGSVGRTALAVGSDVLSFLPRGAVGAYEGLKKNITGKGRDLDVSMAQVGDYGADKTVDTKTGQEREETLSEHFDAVKEAFRVDAAGVTKDILKESIRDPLTGASIVAAVGSDGLLAPALASRAAPLFAQLAKKYGTVAKAAGKAGQAARILARAHEKLETAGTAAKLVAGITEEGVSGGLQGVLMNYATGADKDAWNTFVTEGVEEGAFGAVMAPLHAGWNMLSKAQQLETLNGLRDEMQAEQNPQLAGPTGSGARPSDQGVMDAEFTDVPKQQLPPPVPPPGAPPGAAGVTPGPNGRTYVVTPAEAGGGVQLADGRQIPITEALPPGVPWSQVAKKIENPGYQTQEDKAALQIEQQRREKVKHDIKLLTNATQALQDAAGKATEKAIAEAHAEVAAEDKAAVDGARKAHEALVKDIDAITDPTTATPFPAWNRLFGDHFPSMEAKLSAFTDFHVDEGKKLKTVKERISPPAEAGEGKGNAKSAGASAPDDGGRSKALAADVRAKEEALAAVTDKIPPGGAADAADLPKIEELKGRVEDARTVAKRERTRQVAEMFPDGPVDPDGIRKALLRLPETTKTGAMAEGIYQELAKEVDGGKGLPGFLATDMAAAADHARRGTWKDVSSVDPTPLLRLASQISRTLGGNEIPDLPAAAPAGGTIAEGGQDGQSQPGREAQAPVSDPGNGGGQEPGLEPAGRAAGEIAGTAGNDRPGRDVEPDGGLQGRSLDELPREPGEPRPVADATAFLPPADAAQKFDADTNAREANADFRPTPAPVWANMDLRGKAPIVLTKGMRVEINKLGKAIVERYLADPSSVTAADREILRQYTGQGGLGAKADEDAVAGILNQHYTNYQTIRFAWELVRASGYPMDRKLLALEPAAGIGNFIGHAPEGVSFHANEVDETSARILEILYPRNIQNRMGPFESYVGPKVDLVLTNVPFLRGRGAFEYLETDPAYKGINSIHNYFLMKGIDQLRDNGVGIFITSTGTMDAMTGEEFRKAFNLKAEIVTAFRLPAGTFSKNTGYDGSVDLIYARKRTLGERSTAAEDRLQKDFVETISVEVTSKYGDKRTETAYRSRYYETHPQNVIGELTYGEARGLTQSVVKLAHGTETFEEALAKRFEVALSSMKDAYIPATGAELDENLSGVGEAIGRAHPDTPTFGLEVRDGRVYRKDKFGDLRQFRPDKNVVTDKAGKTVEKEWDIPESRFVLLTELMQAADDLRLARAAGSDVKAIQENIKSLMDLWVNGGKYSRQPVVENGGRKVAALPGVYATRKKVQMAPGDFKYRPEIKFGDPALVAYAGMDRRFGLIRGLYDKKLLGYSAVLTAPVELKAAPHVEKGDMKTGRGVVEYLLQKFGVFRDPAAKDVFVGTDEEFHRAMMAEPSLNWTDDGFEHDNEYLQGDLRDKIAYAEKMGLKKQVAKLQKALPEQRTALTVPAQPHETWWTGDALTAFGHFSGILGRGHRIARVRYGLSEKFQVLQGDAVLDIPYGTEEPLASFLHIALNQRVIRVPDPSGARNEKGDPMLVSDYKATQDVKVEWQKKFENYARGVGQSHAEAAARSFNKDFASNGQGKIDESNIHIAGLSTTLDGRAIVPYASQMSLVRRALMRNGYIAAHGVGHGKTLGAVFTLAELRNRGMAKKACFVVPGKNRGMWNSNLTQVIAGLQVKIIASEGAARRLDLVDAASNDYDVVLMSYETFKTIPLAKGGEFIQRDIDLYEEEYRRLENEKTGNSYLKDGQLKRLQEKLVKLENKLHENHEVMKDPQGVTTFEDLNFDVMFSDESHLVKNSFEQMNEYADRSFLNQNSDSHIGNDMVYKSRYLHERNGRGGMYMLTATPTPNNPLEIYKIIKLVAPWEWTTRNINTVDDFIRDFVEIGPIEAPGLNALAGRQKEGVIGWKNLRALRQILATWMDFRKDNPQVKKPEVIARPTLVDMNEAQLNLMAEILVLSDMSPKEMMKLGVNHLSLTTRAKQLSVDPGLVDAKLLDTMPYFYDRAPKLKAVMDNVEKHFKADKLGNQIIFLDNFRIRDFFTMKDAKGEPIPWPKGFGYLGATASGDVNYPTWMESLKEDERAKMMVLLQDNRGDVSHYSPSLFKDGEPLTPTVHSIESYFPFFDPESGEVFIQQDGLRENLHDSMRRYAIDKIGMDPQRVFVVNANENGKPEDKTRLEGLVADGQVSLIIGNSPSLAEGLNLQNRGRAIHHIDVPWTPKELEQRNGRMWRPRTEADDTELAIYNYIGRGSMDAKGYTILDNKAKWQQDLFVGNDDHMNNAINNIENTGFSYKDFAESAKVNPEFVAGYRMSAAFMRDADMLVGQVKERDRLSRALEVQKNLYAEAQRKVEDAKERITEGYRKQEMKEAEVTAYNAENPQKPKMMPEAYDPTYQNAIIERNQAAVDAGPKLIAAAEERLKPFEKISLDSDITKNALAYIREVKDNKWKTLATTFGDANTKGIGTQFAGDEVYANLLKAVFPDLMARSPLLADMIGAKVLKRLPTKETAAADADKLRAWSTKTTGQAGKVPLSVLLHVVGGTVFAGLFGLGGLGVYGAGLGLWYAARRAAKADIAKSATWSLRARLMEMPGFDRLNPKINRYRFESNKNIARDFYAYEEGIKGLSEEERALIPGFIEGTQKNVPPQVVKAARSLQLVFKRVAEEALKVGIEMNPDLTYYPRFLDFDLIQKMKADPALFEENVQHLMKTQGWPEVEANLFLQAYFDGSQEMRAERDARAQEELAKWIRDKFPKISDADFAKLYNKIQTRFGGRILGNLKYGRVAPKLLDKMYRQDPVYVMSRYIPGAWRTIAQKQFFGENNAAINTFLDTNFPAFRGSESEGRKEVKSWFYAELNDGRFGAAAKNPVTGKGLEWDTARKITAYQYWTKIGTSPISPIRNIAYAFNMAMPLAGIRSTFAGLALALREAVPGVDYTRARIAGAVSDRLILDAYDLARGGESNAWIYMKDKLRYKWHPFTMTEKFNRVFGFYAGIEQGKRLLGQVVHGKTPAVRDAAAARLSEIIGPERLAESLRAGALTRDAEDLFGVGMTEAINGTTRPLDLPKWANTPEGTVAMQFKRLGFRQTVVWRDEVLAPMKKGNYGPFMRWAVAQGMTTPVIALLAAGLPLFLSSLFGSDPEEKEPKEKTPAEEALQWASTLNMLGLYGDMAAGLNSGDDFGDAPLFGTLAGPTLGSATHLAKDIFYDFGVKNESAGKQMNQILRRELPMVNVLTKAGILPEGGVFPQEE